MNQINKLKKSKNQNKPQGPIMKKILFVILIILFSLNAETLFEIKNASDQPVFSISDDGMRVINNGDTMMVITAAEAKINLDNSKDKALSRSFSVTTSTTGKAGLANVLEVTTDATTMREGVLGNRYTNFSPENIFIGLNSGINSTGVNNVFVGNQAGLTNGTGFSNVFVGPDAGTSNSGGDENVFMGYRAGQLNSSGNRNVYLGNEAGMSNISGFQNICIGDAAGKNNTAILSVFIGTSAGIDNTSGTANMFIGNQAGANNTTGGFNNYLGWMSGVHCNGTNNTLLGTMSGWGNYTGDNNVYLGMGAGQDNNGGSNNVFIGYNTTVFGSNKLAIDNFETSTPLIYGDFSTNALTINGTLTTTGNATVGGTFTSNGNAIFKGTSLQIYTNPGTGIDPTNYVYQGSGLQSTSKQFAFTVNDALWVTSNAYIDGTANIVGSTSLSTLTTSGNVTFGGDLTFNSTVFNIKNSYDKAIVQGGWSSPWGDFTALNSSYEWQGTKEPGSIITSNNYPLIVTSGNTGTPFSYTYMTVNNIGEIRMPSVYGDIVGAIRRDLYIDNTGKLGYISSSKRYKKNIKDMEDVSWLFKLRPVNYSYKTDNTNKKEYGLIAEEVEEVNKSFVSYNTDGIIETVSYSELITPMLKAIQDQQKEIEELKREEPEL